MKNFSRKIFLFLVAALAQNFGECFAGKLYMLRGSRMQIKFDKALKYNIDQDINDNLKNFARTNLQTYALTMMTQNINIKKNHLAWNGVTKENLFTELVEFWNSISDPKNNVQGEGILLEIYESDKGHLFIKQPKELVEKIAKEIAEAQEVIEQGGCLSKSTVKKILIGVLGVTAATVVYLCTPWEDLVSWVTNRLSQEEVIYDQVNDSFICAWDGFRYQCLQIAQGITGLLPSPEDFGCRVLWETIVSNYLDANATCIPQ